MFRGIINYILTNDKLYKICFPKYNFYFYKYLAYTEWHNKLYIQLHKYHTDNILNYLKCCKSNITILEEIKNKRRGLFEVYNKVFTFGVTSIFVFINLILVSIGLGDYYDNKFAYDFVNTLRHGLINIIFIFMTIILLGEIIDNYRLKKRILLIQYYKELEKILSRIYETRCKIYFME